jgi:ligand-binding SRPBCC domain-containing protein
MKIYKVERTTFLKADMAHVWDFFSSPENLNKLTPPDVSFQILSDTVGKKMYAGMIINYKIKPFPLVAFRWTTEITHCEEGKYFVDEQRFGPYSFWHHQHIFIEKANGIEMTDIVHYGLPFGPLGTMMNGILVKKKLEGIFDYRGKVVTEIFPS